MNLSDNTLAICKANYTTNCYRCPIRPQCVDGSRPHTRDQIDAWVDRVNKAAEVIEIGN